MLTRLGSALLLWKGNQLLVAGSQIGNSFVRCLAAKAVKVFDRTVEQRRGSLHMIQVEPEKWKPVATPEVLKLADVFKRHGYEIRIAGGAVRDILQGKKPDDVDFATNALPDEMKSMFNEENIRMLNLKGEKHGTVTVRLDDKENFEVTTLRIDVKTDGRHAEVEFTKDWALDAGRRDLTFNSMFLDLNGNLYDYFGGQEDLAAKRVRFVGNAVDRIQEDYLRILRYFRFYSKIAVVPNHHDQETLKAIRDNAHGLARISGERIWTELRRFAVGRFAPELVTLMFDLGLGPHMGFPESALKRTEDYVAIFAKASQYNPEPVTMLSSLLENESEAKVLNQRLKLSNEELSTILIILKFRQLVGDGKPVDWYKRLVGELFHIEPRCRDNQAKARVAELAKYCGDGEVAEHLVGWTIPTFPVEGYDLMQMGVPRGKQFGALVNDLKAKWIASDFNLAKDEMIQLVAAILAAGDPNKDRSPHK